MIGILWFLSRMYRFAQVEELLFRLHDVQPPYRLAFKARFKYIQRQGVNKDSPGSGKRISYSLEDVLLIAFCIELAQFGIDPTKIGQVRSRIWPFISKFMLEDSPGEDQLFAAWPFMMSSSALEHSETLNGPFLGLISASASAREWVFPTSQAASLIEERALFVNLTSLRRRVLNLTAKFEVS